MPMNKMFEMQSCTEFTTLVVPDQNDLESQGTEAISALSESVKMSGKYLERCTRAASSYRHRKDLQILFDDHVLAKGM